MLCIKYRESITKEERKKRSNESRQSERKEKSKKIALTVHQSQLEDSVDAREKVSYRLERGKKGRRKEEGRMAQSPVSVDQVMQVTAKLHASSVRVKGKRVRCV